MTVRNADALPFRCTPMALIWIVVFALFSPRNLLAQDQVGEREREQARTEFNLALAAIEGSNWQSAYEHMLRARTLNPTSLRILSGLAVAQTNVGLLLEARESYRTWLQQGRDQPADARADIQRQLDDVERDMPQLNMRVNGLLDGDVLTLDGEPQNLRGEPLRMNPGRHELAIVRDGRVVSRGFVEMGAGGRANYELTAPPRVITTGTIRVEASVAAEVYIDGTLIGRTPGEFPVPQGRHVLELRAPGHVPHQRNVDVSPQQVAEVSVQLARADARLGITTNVPAMAYLDGRLLGNTPGEYDVGPGRHTLEVRAEGHAPFRRDLEFESNHTSNQDVTLVPVAASQIPIERRDDTVAWIVGISAGVAVIAAGVLIYGFVIEPQTRQQQPFQGNFGDPIVIP